MADWFQNLLGFPEGTAAEVKELLSLEGHGVAGGFADLLQGGVGTTPARLRSAANGHEFAAGHFSTPSLAELRELGLRALADAKSIEAAGLRGAPSVEHAVGDVSEFHRVSANRYALFQVASQFNCLEFVSPSSTPEMGITRYTGDRTQGPCCAVACGAGTVYRNYFAPVQRAGSPSPAEGQTAACQIECLRDLDAELGGGESGRYFDVQGGYTLASDAGLRALCLHLRSGDADEGWLDALRGKLRIGLQVDTEVTSRAWGAQLLRQPDQLVTQVFGSACSVAYSHNSKDLWEPFARLVLEASYEATLWVAVLCALRRGGKGGSRRVFLTSLGGGVFGNSMDWVAGAIDRAVGRVCATNGLALQIFLVSYAPPVHAALEGVVQRCRTGRYLPDPANLQDTLQYDTGCEISPASGASPGAGDVAATETLMYDGPPAVAGADDVNDVDQDLAQDDEHVPPCGHLEDAQGAEDTEGRRSAGQLDLRAAFAASAASSSLGLEECGGAAPVSADVVSAPSAGSGGMLSAFNLQPSRWQNVPEPGESLSTLSAGPVLVDVSQASPAVPDAGPSVGDDWGWVVPLMEAPVSLLPSGRAIFAQLPQCWLDFSARSDALGTRCLFASRRHEHSVFAPVAADELIRLPLAASGWQPPRCISKPPAAAAKLADEEPWSVEIHPGQCTVRVLLRPAMLLLRMLRRGSALPSATFSWRALDTSALGCAALADEAPRRHEAMGQFSVLSNLEDAAHPQPPHFKEFPLRREQLRSLGWMVSQERRRREPFAAELREAVPCADAPHWKLEGCLRCEYRDVKGGVLADAIGYGKTACTIGLVDCTRNEALPEVPAAFHGFLPSRATLVLAPTNLHQQWLREITKFTGDTLKVISVPTYAQLKKLTEREIREADVIVATYRLFYSTPYLRRLEELARSVRPEFSFPSSKGGHGAASARQPAEWAAAYRRAVELLPAACGGAGPAADPVTPVRPPSASQAALADDETPEQTAQLERPSRRRKLEKAAPARGGGSPVAEASASASADVPTQPYAPCSQPSAVAASAETAEHALGGGRKRRLTGKQSPASQPAGGSEEAALSARPEGRSSIGSDMRTRYLPLEAFWWRRVVCDEFHELLGRYPPAQVAVEAFHADYKWGLSGTPPCQTLAQIRRAAGFLGVQLPASSAGDDGGEAARRVAQEWLDAFMRRNTAELPPLDEEECIVPVRQTPKERALYLALTEQQRPLPSLDAPGVGAGGVAEPPEFHAARQGASGLLKLCSHFCASGAADVLTAEDECQRQLALRRERLRAAEREARSLVDRAANTARLVRHFEPHWCRAPDAKDYPYLDRETTAAIKSRLRVLGAPAGANKLKADLLSRLFEQLGATSDEGLKDRVLRPDFAGAGDAGAGCTSDGAPTGSPTFGAWRELEASVGSDEQVSTAAGALGSDDEAAGRERIRSIAKEVLATAAAADGRAAGGGPAPPRCARLRADLGMPRWPTAAQLAAAAAAGGPDGEKNADAVWCEFRQADWAWRADAENAKRLRKVVDAWKADSEKCAQQLAGLAGQLGARLLATHSFQQTLHASQQGAVDAVETRQEPTRRFAKYGSKIEAIVRHVQKLQKEDKGCKIICFVQWEDLKRKVAAALDEFNIGNLTLSGSVWKRREALTQFQYDQQGPRLLLLSLEESASGTNLTAANHVIIVHPMEAATKEEAVAFEMQAVGRVRRPGQRRKIHIWRFVTVDTIEQVITEEHQKELWERQQATLPVTQPGQAGPDSSGDEAQLFCEAPAEGEGVEGGGNREAWFADAAAATQAYMPAPLPPAEVAAAAPAGRGRARRPRAGAAEQGGARRRSRSGHGGGAAETAAAIAAAAAAGAAAAAAAMGGCVEEQLDTPSAWGKAASNAEAGQAVDATQRY